MNYDTQKIINKLTFGLSEMGAGFTLSDIWYNFKYGIKNLRRFFWVIWKYRGWDYTYNLLLLKRGLEVYLTFPNYEVDKGRIPKENDIKRVIQIIENLYKSPYLSFAEKELGEIVFGGMDFKELKEKDDKGEKLYEWVDGRTKKEKKHSDKVFKRSEELEQNEWNELFDTMKNKAQGWWKP